MKASVVLCVLMWSGLARGNPPSQVCTSGVCGCCIIEHQLQRINTFFDELYNKMSTEFNESKQAVLDMKDHQVVFSAVLNSSAACDPAASAATVVYNNASVNVGEAYNNSSGVFKAPYKGVYSFSVSIYNNSENKSCAALILKGSEVYLLSDKDTSDKQDSSSVSGTWELDEGDEVYVEQPQDCVMCAQDNLYNTFTGYLLYTKPTSAA